MNIVLVNLPVHIPTVMPYSLTMMAAVLKSNLNERILPLDLNAFYHRNKFEEYYVLKDSEFFKALTKFEAASRTYYQKLSKDARTNGNKEDTTLLVKNLLILNPDAVCISFTYNSQIYFAQGIIDELIKKGIKAIIGGPADHSKLKGVTVLKSYSELICELNNLGAKTFSKMQNALMDFSAYKKADYFTKDIIYPLRTAISCPYRRCTFCTHHGNMPYQMMDLSTIKDIILKNEIKKICFIDDDFPILRLKELSFVLSPLKVKWWCQLRPVKELIPLLPKLYESGLRSVAWGVESGCQRVLDKMEKGTNIEDISNVLESSKQVGIKNMVYVMFGLPTETEDEFMQTINFLENNSEAIDLVSLSVFGLQEGSRIYDSPKEFGVQEIKKLDRTLYGEKISYEPIFGLSQEQAKELKLKIKGRINRINKIPKIINSCKEQVLNL